MTHDNQIIFSDNNRHMQCSTLILSSCPSSPSYYILYMYPSPKMNKNTTDPSHKTCYSCQQLLPRHLFSKKEYKSPIHPRCHTCRQNETAQRCQQEPKAFVKLGRTAESGITRRPNNFGYCNYLDLLFSLHCFPDIVNLKAFHSAKDVSESMAALQAFDKHGTTNNNNNNKNKKKSRVHCLCIGDGSTPRTAVLACFLNPQWTCVSIDPALQQQWQGTNPKGVQRLTGFGGTLEEFLQQPPPPSASPLPSSSYDVLVLLCVHSHARLTGTASIDNIRNRYHTIPVTTLVSLPCCPKFRSHRDVGRPPDIQYDDDCVFSACRKVEIWNFESPPSTFVCGDIEPSL
jgi:hypothetical protein